MASNQRQSVVRLCVRKSDLAKDRLPRPDDILIRECHECEQEVWYDPACSIPILGPELILCTQCIDVLLEGDC